MTGWIAGIRSFIGGFLLLLGIDISSPPYPSLADLPLLFALEQNGFLLTESTLIPYILLAGVVGILLIVVGMFMAGITLKRLMGELSKAKKENKTFMFLFLFFLAFLFFLKVSGTFSVAGYSTASTSGEITFTTLLMNIFVAVVASIIATVILAVYRIQVKIR